MKKHYSLLLAILVAFSSFFVSCNENDYDLASIICKITVKSDGGGTVSITNYVGAFANVVIGNNVEVVAAPAKGFVFKGWYVGNSQAPISTETNFIFTASENITLIARFAKLYNLTLCSGGYGSVSFKDSADTFTAVLPGTEVTVVATPDEDCDFIGWFVGEAEEPVSADAEYTFTVTEEDITLTAKFSKRPVVTVRSAGRGSVSIKDVYGTSKAYLPGSEVTVVATPNEDSDFIGWFVGDDETPVSTDAEYTFAVIVDITLTAQFERRKTYIDGYEYIDLGLPSGIKWATCNVDATTPEEYGGYYAWGETEEKSNYSWDTYKWCNGSYYTLTKYCTDSSYGTVDNKTVLDPEDDVAHVKWGGTWRMPTKAEQNELLWKCTWTWITQNGVKGYKVTSKTNGNSIFLPATGDRHGTAVNDRGRYGYYWSSSLNSDYSSSADASDFGFSCGGYDWDYEHRYYGKSVRPVSE